MGSELQTVLVAAQTEDRSSHHRHMFHSSGRVGNASHHIMTFAPSASIPTKQRRPNLITLYVRDALVCFSFWVDFVTKGSSTNVLHR
jgi:hypothetical protein